MQSKYYMVDHFTPLFFKFIILFLMFKINLFIYLFIYGCVGSSLLRVGFL